MQANPTPRIIVASVCLLLTTVAATAQFVGNDPAAIDKRVNDIVAKMTLDEKIEILGGDTPFRTHAIPRLGIPYFQMADGPVGAHIPAPTIAYAAGIGLAASWDRTLAQRIGYELGRDSRSRGAAFILGPGVNIYRAPMNGRNFEYFGEDPFLGGAIAVGYIQGVQKAGVSATVKHYLGNNSEYLRHDTDSIIDERAPSRDLHAYLRGRREAGEGRRHHGLLQPHQWRAHDAESALQCRSRQGSVALPGHHHVGLGLSL